MLKILIGPYRGGGWLLQLFFGAAAGMFVVLLTSSGVLDLPGTEAGSQLWASRGLYAFIAGFSEPFFLRAVQRITPG